MCVRVVVFFFGVGVLLFFNVFEKKKKVCQFPLSTDVAILLCGRIVFFNVFVKKKCLDQFSLSTNLAILSVWAYCCFFLFFFYFFYGRIIKNIIFFRQILTIY